MIKSLKVILLILLVGLLYVVFNQYSTYDYLYPNYHLSAETIEITGYKSLVKQDQATLIPVRYKGSLDFDTIPEEIRKEVFINFMLPAIVIERDRLYSLLQRIEFIEMRMVNKRNIRAEDLQFFKDLMEKYDASSIKDLKIKLYPHPVSLVLAQAILESGWGTSNAFAKARNPFGILSFASDEPRRKFINPDNKSEIWVRSYSDVNQAVEHYYFFTARLASYEKFRKKRWERGSTKVLMTYLRSYHEAKDYNALIESIIRSNDLEKYDNISIKKDYFSYRKDYFQILRSFFSEYI